MALPERNLGSQRRQASTLLDMDTHLTPAEAHALLELLEDKAHEFVVNPYSPELAEALRKVRAAAEGPPSPTRQ
ncbi:hypothetical protein DEMA109039_18340 [Deinococcus marmoris]